MNGSASTTKEIKDFRAVESEGLPAKHDNKFPIRYEILAKLGRGGMGTVYAAFDTKLARNVAIKKFSVFDEKRFLREAQTAAGVSHPNLVKIYDYELAACAVSLCAFLIMELVDGKSLDLLKKISHKDALNYLTQICEGIKALHENDIVHRDIKPANILVGKKQEVKITDYGLAKPVNEKNLTQAGFVAGTPDYLAPEVRSGTLATKQSDIFSIGVVLYEMLNSRLPDGRHGKTKLDNIARKAMLENMNERYKAIDEILDDLKELPSFGIEMVPVVAIKKHKFDYWIYVWAAVVVSFLLLIYLLLQ